MSIPDAMPAAAAAAATTAMEAAAEKQRFTNQQVGAKIIADALMCEPMDQQRLDSMEIVFLHLALPWLVEKGMSGLLPKLIE